MRLLIVVKSNGRPETLASATMRWLPRTGFKFCVLVPPEEREAYQQALEMAAEEHYLHIPQHKLVDAGKNMMDSVINDMVKQYKADLVLHLPDDIMRFGKRGKAHSDGPMAINFAAAIGACRAKMSQEPSLAMIGFKPVSELFGTALWGPEPLETECRLMRTALGGVPDDPYSISCNLTGYIKAEQQP